MEHLNTVNLKHQLSIYVNLVIKRVPCTGLEHSPQLLLTPQLSIILKILNISIYYDRPIIEFKKQMSIPSLLLEPSYNYLLQYYNNTTYMINYKT